MPASFEGRAAPTMVEPPVKSSPLTTTYPPGVMVSSSDAPRFATLVIRGTGRRGVGSGLHQQSGSSPPAAPRPDLAREIHDIVLRVFGLGCAVGALSVGVVVVLALLGWAP